MKNDSTPEPKQKIQHVGLDEVEHAATAALRDHSGALAEHDAAVRKGAARGGVIHVRRRDAGIGAAASTRRGSMKPISEKSIQAEIRTLLELNGFSTHHLEVFAAASVDYEGRTRRFTEGTPGQADLIAVRAFSGGVVGLTQTIYIEVKRKGSKSKKHQECWQAVRRREGFAVLSDCRSWADVVNQARQLGIEVERPRTGGTK